MYEPDPVPIAGTRGPRGREDSPTPLAANVPLTTGPLGPLVPRLDLRGAVRSIELYWGADEHGRFPCPIPGHTGCASLGVPPDDPEQDLRLLCCRGRWRTLGEVRAAQSYGKDGVRSNIEIATWLRRLLYECRRFEPVSVPMPEPPAEAHPRIALAAAGFALLAGLRWADGPPGPLPFSVRFCAAWCRLSHRDARLAISELLEAGMIRHTESTKGLRLYVPAQVLRLVDVLGTEDAVIAAVRAAFNAVEVH